MLLAEQPTKSKLSVRSFVTGQNLKRQIKIIGPGSIKNWSITKASLNLNRLGLILQKNNIRIQSLSSMSHFSFSPFYFYPNHSQTQFQQNLHSLYFSTEPQQYYTYLSPFPSHSQGFHPFPLELNQPSINHANPQVLGNVAIKQEIPYHSTNINNLVSDKLTIKAEISDRSQGSSIYSSESSKACSKNRKVKTNKKPKSKKLSKKQRTQPQMKRNAMENSKRNIIPNEIHQMLSVILKKSKSTDLLQKLLAKYSNKLTQNCLSVQRFYLYQSLLKDKISHYANEQSLRHLLRLMEPRCEIYSRAEQEIYCKVGLVMISKFLRDQAALIILNSKRIKSSNKLEHLKTKRYLQTFLQQMIAETFHQKKDRTSQ